jgi:hypothetical protein
MINKTSTTRFAPASSGGLPRNTDSSSAARSSTNKGLDGGAADAALEEGAPSIWAEVRAVPAATGRREVRYVIAPLELVAEVNDEG